MLTEVEKKLMNYEMEWDKEDGMNSWNDICEPFATKDVFTISAYTALVSVKR